MLRKILALMKKEFRTILKNKKSRMVLIIPPIAQILVFGYSASFDLNNVPYAVYNEDPGLASRQLLARFSGVPEFAKVATITRDSGIAPLINEKKVMLVLHIGPDFTRNLNRGRTAKLQVILDGRNSNSALISLNYVRDIVKSFNMQWAARHGMQPVPAQLVVRSWFNETLNSHWFIIPGIVALLALVVTLEVTALSVAKEREAGTFDQLLVTPMTPLEILIGKSLPGFIIGFVEATFIIAMTILWFHVPFRGSFLVLYIGIFAFLLSAIGIGLMISAISVTQQQGLMGAFLFLVPAVILSGFATPIENMPQFVQYITYLNPMRYFLIIVRASFLEGASFSLLWNLYWPMVIIGIVTLSAAGILFRNRMY